MRITHLSKAGFSSPSQLTCAPSFKREDAVLIGSLEDVFNWLCDQSELFSRMTLNATGISKNGQVNGSA